MTTAIVARESGTKALSRADIVGSRLYPHIRTPEQAGVVIAKAVNHDLCPTFVAENLIPIEGKMAGTGLYLAAVLAKTKKYRTVTTANDATKAVIEFWELVPYMGKDGGSGWVRKGTETFTLEDAKRAGLDGKRPWKQYPQHMTYWRALAGGSRKHCADAIAGSFTHLVEELDSKDEIRIDEDGVPVIDAEVVEAVEKASAEDIAELRALMEETATSAEKVEGHFGKKLEEMDGDEAEQAKRLLQAKKTVSPAKAKEKATKAA